MQVYVTPLPGNREQMNRRFLDVVDTIDPDYIRKLLYQINYISGNKLCYMHCRELNPDSIVVKYFLIVWGGGGLLTPCLCFELLIGQKLFFKILNWNFETNAVSNRVICFLTAVLSLCEKGYFFFFKFCVAWCKKPPPPTNTIRVKKLGNGQWTYNMSKK